MKLIRDKIYKYLKLLTAWKLISKTNIRRLKAPRNWRMIRLKPFLISCRLHLLTYDDPLKPHNHCETSPLHIYESALETVVKYLNRTPNIDLAKDYAWKTHGSPESEKDVSMFHVFKVKIGAKKSKKYLFSLEFSMKISTEGAQTLRLGNANSLNIFMSTRGIKSNRIAFI